MATLSEYLRQRGLNLDPIEIQEGFDPIMANEGLVKEAAELWESKNSLIRLVLQARINAILKYQVEKAIPEEVMVYRQALVEIGAIISDFEKYKGEHGRREATKQSDNREAEEVPSDPPKEGEEGSL